MNFFECEMPLGKRKSLSYNYRAKRARLTGSMTAGARKIKASSMYRPMVKFVAKRVNSLYRMIETKETSRTGTINLALAHNNITVFGSYNQANLPYSIVSVCNPFSLAQGADDAMNGVGQRIGDAVNVRGLMIKGFFENALERPKVYYRVMLIRGAKGETFSRDTIFKNASQNKMIDQVNTERFSVVAQKIFNISSSNGTANTVTLTGVPVDNSLPDNASAGIGTKTFKMWIPGRKFGRNGYVQYENQSATQVKFYDYRICILAYDWYGTPQDANAVGRVNEMYTKLYFKDA